MRTLLAVVTLHVGRFAIVAALAGCLACAPLNPSQSSVVGRWQVEWTCGREVLDLKSDGTYVYAIDFASGGRVTDSGRWRIIPKTVLFDGAHVVLENALHTCVGFGEKAIQPERADRHLSTIWEWGRMMLSFDPDLEGFTRAPS